MNTPSKTHSSKLIILLSILSAVGAAITIWQTRLYYLTRSGAGGFKSFCNIGQTFDCTAVEMSKYSELIPGIPLSGFAIAGYLLILFLSFIGFSESKRSSILKPLFVFSAISFLFSLIYLVIMLGIIGKLCLFCLFVDGINAGLLVFSFQLLKQHKNEGSSSTLPVKNIVIAGLSSLFVAFLIAKALNPQATVSDQDMNDMVDSIMATPPIALTLPADAPVVGNPNAAITIVKFSDYQCPACKMGATALHPLLKRYPNELKIVYLNYPLDSECNSQLKRRVHDAACESARIAICAHEQGKFKEVYELLFEKQEQLASGKVTALVKDIPGIDIAKIDECVARPSTQEKIKADVELGTMFKIQSTPTFFINGRKIEGGLPTNLWISVIDKLLKMNSP